MGNAKTSFITEDISGIQGKSKSPPCENRVGWGTIESELVMNRTSKHTGLGLALGAALGTVFGVVAGRLGAWLPIGVAIGMLLGASFWLKTP
jgi:hypothetical protein